MVLRGFKPRAIVAPTPFPHNGDPHPVALAYPCQGRAEPELRLRNLGRRPPLAVLPRAVAYVRSALGERAFEAARAECRAMTFEQPVSYALEGDEA